MISRPHWIAAFIGRALRQGHATDPDWVYDTADDLYLGMCELDPEFAADSAFGALRAPGSAAGKPDRRSGGV
jgi:hypothetical protein